MRTAETLLAIVLGGVALGACGSSNSPDLFGPDTDDGGAPASGVDAATDGSRLSSDSGSSADGGSSSDSGAPADGGSLADSGAPSTASGFAIPLASPDGPDQLYTAQVTAGNQTFAMDLDTGSTSLGVAGTGCSGCTGLSPDYMPSSSATATGKTGKSTFADGSGWSGPIYKDTVSLGNGTPAVALDLVDITKANGGFFDSTNDYQGILGLGPSGNAVTGTTGYIPALTSAGIPNVFAFQLCDNTGSNAGTMWLGGDGPSVSLVYTPLLPISNDNAFYAIDVDGMSLGGASVVANAANTFQQPVLDTGTSLFYVPTSVFNAFQIALEASSGYKALFGANTFASGGNDAGCVTGASVTDAQVEASLPPLALSLPNAVSGQPDVTIQASPLDTYLNSGGSGQYCLAIQDGGTQDASTFGDAFLQAFVTVIDVDGGRVGFAPTGCATPELRRARHPAKNGPHRGPRPDRR